MRKPLVSILGVVAVVVAACVAYEVAPEIRARFVASRMMRLMDRFATDPRWPQKAGISHHRVLAEYATRELELEIQLLRAACDCDDPRRDGLVESGTFPARIQLAWLLSRRHGEACLYVEIRRPVSEHEFSRLGYVRHRSGR